MSPRGVSDALETGNCPLGNVCDLVMQALSQAGRTSFTLETRVTNIPLPGVLIVTLDPDVCMFNRCGSRACGTWRRRQREQQQQEQPPEVAAPAAPEPQAGHGLPLGRALAGHLSGSHRPGRPAAGSSGRRWRAQFPGLAVQRVAFAFAFALAPGGLSRSPWTLVGERPCPPPVRSRRGTPPNRWGTAEVSPWCVWAGHLPRERRPGHPLTAHASRLFLLSLPPLCLIPAASFIRKEISNI